MFNKYLSTLIMYVDYFDQMRAKSNYSDDSIQKRKL